MKKNAKKLKLSRETVQRLGGPDLEGVAGGYTAEGYTCLLQTCGCRTSNGPVACLCVPSLQC